jgi:hypothetical protein
VAFFSVTVDGRNLIFGHKRHIGTPYRGKRFLTRQIPFIIFFTKSNEKPNTKSSLLEQEDF